MVSRSIFPPPDLTIAEAADLIATHKLSPVELTRACLDRIRNFDHRLHTFILVLGESAMVAARAAEQDIMGGRYRGALHGIPIGFKDIFDTRGIATTANSKLLQHNVPAEDSTVVRMLAEAGAINLGKHTTHEFALGGPAFDLPWPPARNPWNTECFTGGSSSGTAAAIAARLVLGGIGSDSGGSVLQPSGYCGIVGLKPTYGRVSRTGMLTLSFSLDHVGPMACTAEDCALLLQSTAGFDPTDPVGSDTPVPNYKTALTGDLRGLRIGVIRHFYETDNLVNDATRKAIEAALDIFRGLGAELRNVTLSPLMDYSATAMVIFTSEAYAIHEQNLRERPNDYGKLFRNQASIGMLYTAADYVHAMHRRRQLTGEFARALADLDIVITAVVTSEAPRIDLVAGWTPHNLAFAAPFNLTGTPAIAVCCGFTDTGLPLSMQIGGKPFDEPTVLRAADAYERATGWRKKRPLPPVP
jgi:aspartyl-tRNA(Asn)/glutamyl-tRNA(Gln) amidotransferase subunit A